MAQLTYLNSQYIIRGTLSIAENALGRQDLVSVTIGSSTRITIDPDLVGYAGDNNAKSWKVTGKNFQLQKPDIYHIYIKCQRNTNDAALFLSTFRYDLEGYLADDSGERIEIIETITDAEGNQLEVDTNNGDAASWYVRLGYITAPVAGKRTAYIDMGKFGTDSGNQESIFNTVAEALKAAVESFSGMFLRRDKDDVTNFGLTMKSLIVAEDADIRGTAQMKNAVVKEKLTATNAEINNANVTNELKAKSVRVDSPSFPANSIASYGEAIDNLLMGKGAFFTKDGRLQLDRLEVRSSMTVMEMIINQLHAMDGDYWFGDSAMIETVTPVMNGDNIVAYTLGFGNDQASRLDAFKWKINDILFSIVSNFGDLDYSGGQLEYYTSWMKVTGTDPSARTITVVLYGDDQVNGGVNFPPKAGYACARRGNTNTEGYGPDSEENRQSAWHLSAREGNMVYYDNLSTPITGEESYKLVLGKLPNLHFLKHFAGRIGLYIDTLLYGESHQVNWQGKVRTNYKDQGNWSAEDAAAGMYTYSKELPSDANDKLPSDANDNWTIITQSRVYHNGFLWACTANSAGKDYNDEEPTWHSTRWSVLSGGRDEDYSMLIHSSRGASFVKKGDDNITTELTASLFFNNQDITTAAANFGADMVQWQWECITKADLDLHSLGSDYKDYFHANTLNVDYAAMGLSGSHAFRCTALIKNGDGWVSVSEDVTIMVTTVADGQSPTIKNGNWWIGDTDTGIKATPDDPDVWTISSDGYWYINGEKTNFKAVGEPGRSVFMAYAFKRSDTPITSAPAVTEQGETKPVGWEDGIPSGTGPVYMTSRCITSDRKAPHQTAWSLPCLMIDTDVIDVAYNASPTRPTGSPAHTNAEDQTNGWHNTATANDVWMAVSTKDGSGNWGAWQITKIKGEKGADATSYIADLTNEMSGVPCDNANYPSSTAILNTSAYLAYGTTELTTSCKITPDNTVLAAYGISATITPNGKRHDIQFTVANTSDNHASYAALPVPLEVVVELTCTESGTHKDAKNTTTFTIVPAQPGANGKNALIYDILPSADEIVFKRMADGNIETGSKTLTCQIRKTDGDLASVIETTDPSLTGYSLRYIKGGDSYPVSNTSGTAYPTTGITVTASDTYVYFALFRGTTLIDKERVAVLTDGVNGNSPRIVDGEWWIGAENTHIKAEAGDPIVPQINDEGYWVINGETTSILARGTNGQAVYTAQVFRRSSTKLTTAPTGGTFANPMQGLSSGWSDGIPTGTLPVYGSTRVFTSDGKSPQQSAWSTPFLLADTADIDMEYSAVATNPGNPTDNASNWHDPATSNDVWMAIRTKVGGVWGSWTVMKFKGEKGADATSYIADLTNEMSGVPCDNGNWPTSAATLKTSAYLAYGTTELATNYKITPNDLDTKYGINVGHTLVGKRHELTFSIPKTSDNHGTYQALPTPLEVVIELTCTETGTHHGAKNSATFTIVPAKPGANGKDAELYELVPSVSTLKVDKNGVLSETKLKVSIQKIVGDTIISLNPAVTSSLTSTAEGHYIASKQGDVSVFYKVDNERSLPIGLDKDGNRYVDAGVPYIEVKASWKQITLLIYKGDNVAASYAIDSETIPILRDGEDGKSLVGINNYYQWGNSGTNAPTGAWTENTIPLMPTGMPYLWNYEQVMNDDGDVVSTSTPTCIGHIGADGKGIDRVWEYYLRTSDATVPTTVPTLSNGNKTITLNGWSETVAAADPDNRYIWNIEVVKYTDGTYYVGQPHTAGVMGEKGAAATTYSIVPSVTSITKDKNGNLSTNNITVLVQQNSDGTPAVQEGNKVNGDYGGQYKEGYITQFFGSMSMWYKTKKTDYLHSYDKENGIVLDDSAEYVHFQLHLGTSINGPIMATMTIPIIADGADGTPGTSPYTFDLNNEMTSVACTTAGKPISSTTVTTKGKFLLGATELTMKDVTISGVPSGVTSSITGKTTKEATISLTFPITATLAAKNDFTITAKADATINGETKELTATAVFSVAGVRAGSPGTTPTLFELLPSASSITLDKDNNLSASTLTVNIQKQVGDTITTHTPAASTSIQTAGTWEGVSVWWRGSGMSASVPYGLDADGNAVSGIPVNKAWKYIILSMYKGATNTGWYIDVETIPIVKDGQNGAHGITYSLTATPTQIGKFRYAGILNYIGGKVVSLSVYSSSDGQLTYSQLSGKNLRLTYSVDGGSEQTLTALSIDTESVGMRNMLIVYLRNATTNALEDSATVTTTESSRTPNPNLLRGAMLQRGDAGEWKGMTDYTTVDGKDNIAPAAHFDTCGVVFTIETPGKIPTGTSKGQQIKLAGTKIIGDSGSEIVPSTYMGETMRRLFSFTYGNDIISPVFYRRMDGLTYNASDIYYYESDNQQEKYSTIRSADVTSMTALAYNRKYIHILLLGYAKDLGSVVTVSGSSYSSVTAMAFVDVDGNTIDPKTYTGAQYLRVRTGSGTNLLSGQYFIRRSIAPTAVEIRYAVTYSSAAPEKTTGNYSAVYTSGTLTISSGRYLHIWVRAKYGSGGAYDMQYLVGTENINSPATNMKYLQQTVQGATQGSDYMLSFWYRASLAKLKNVNQYSADHFGINVRLFQGSSKFTRDNETTRKLGMVDQWTNVQIPYHTYDSSPLQLLFDLDEGKEIEITQPKLETGTVATDFTTSSVDQQGFPGCQSRVWMNELEGGKEYRNDTNTRVSRDGYFNDFVMVLMPEAITGGTMPDTSGYLCFRCRRTHTNSYSRDFTDASDFPDSGSIIRYFDDQKDGNANLWERISGAGAQFFQTIIAANANVRMLTGSCFVIQDSANKIVAGMGDMKEGTTPYNIWAGGEKSSTAPYVVYKNGVVKSALTLTTGTILNYANITERDEDGYYQLSPVKDGTTLLTMGKYILPKANTCMGLQYRIGDLSQVVTDRSTDVYALKAAGGDVIFDGKAYEVFLLNSTKKIAYASVVSIGWGWIVESIVERGVIGAYTGRDPITPVNPTFPGLQPGIAASDRVG